MSYTPTEWTAGDVITADKLNNAEEGIAAANAAYPGIDVLIRIDVDVTEYYEPVATATILKGDRVTDGQRALAGEYVGLQCYIVIVNGPRTETKYAAIPRLDVLDENGEVKWIWDSEYGINEGEQAVAVFCGCVWDADGLHVTVWPTN